MSVNTNLNMPNETSSQNIRMFTPVENSPMNKVRLQLLFFLVILSTTFCPTFAQEWRLIHEVDFREVGPSRHGLDLHADGTAALADSVNGRLHVFNSLTGGVEKILRPSGWRPGVAAASGTAITDQVVAVDVLSQHLTLFDLDSGEPLYEFRPSDFGGVSFRSKLHAAGSDLAFSVYDTEEFGDDRSIVVLDIATGQESFRTSIIEERSIGFDISDDTIAYKSGTDVIVANIRTQEELFRLDISNSLGPGIDVQLSGSHLMLRTFDSLRNSDIELYELESGDFIRSFQAPADTFFESADVDGDHLIVGYDVAELPIFGATVYEISTGEVAFEFPEYEKSWRDRPFVRSNVRVSNGIALLTSSKTVPDAGNYVPLFIAAITSGVRGDCLH